MYNKYILKPLFITMLVFSGCSDEQVKDDSIDQIPEILSQVSLDSLETYVRELSGETSVKLDGNREYIISRHRNYPGNEQAADYLEDRLLNCGLEVYNQHYGETLRNVYGVQLGHSCPNRHYIFGAHYDSMPDSSISPGADDNASGCAAVLEAARILVDYEPACTIIYAFWDEEEQGLRGSGYYAWLARQNGDDIRGMLNVDMIGWDSNDDRRFIVNTKDTVNSVAMGETLRRINADYSIGLEPVILNLGYGSDNIPFWYWGYSAIGIEEMYGEDWNTFYHTTNDRIAAFNSAYFQQCSQVLIGTLAALALP